MSQNGLQSDVELTVDEVVRATVAVARTLRVADGRLEATLDAVIETANRSTGHDAGLALVENGALVPTTTTTRAAHELDVLQTEVGVGPCLQAATEQRVVRVEDTADEPRWSQFAERAATLGVASMICVPLWIEEHVLGTLSLYSDRPAAFGAADLYTAEICGALAAAAIADARRSEQLRGALERRDLIGQAKGILMERQRLTADQAFDVLAHASQRTNRKLVVVAEQLVETGLLPEPAPGR